MAQTLAVDTEDRTYWEVAAETLGYQVDGTIHNELPIRPRLLWDYVEARLQAQGRRPVTFSRVDGVEEEYYADRIIVAMLGAILGPERVGQLCWERGCPILTRADVDRFVNWHLDDCSFGD